MHRQVSSACYQETAVLRTSGEQTQPPSLTRNRFVAQDSLSCASMSLGSIPQEEHVQVFLDRLRHTTANFDRTQRQESGVLQV